MSMSLPFMAGLMAMSAAIMCDDTIAVVGEKHHLERLNCLRLSSFLRRGDFVSKATFFAFGRI
jgi:hypothetical protein